MYKIKYAGRKVKRILLTLFFATLIAVSVFLVLKVKQMETYRVFLEEEIAGLAAENAEFAKEEGELREVWLSFVDLGGFFEAGDRVDLRAVNPEGEDEKLLAGRNVAAINENGVELRVSEQELVLLSTVEHCLKEEKICRVYMVKIP